MCDRPKRVVSFPVLISQYRGDLKSGLRLVTHLARFRVFASILRYLAGCKMMPKSINPKLLQQSAENAKCVLVRISDSSFQELALDRLRETVVYKQVFVFYTMML